MSIVILTLVFQLKTENSIARPPQDIVTLIVETGSINNLLSPALNISTQPALPTSDLVTFSIQTSPDGTLNGFSLGAYSTYPDANGNIFLPPAVTYSPPNNSNSDFFTVLVQDSNSQISYLIVVIITIMPVNAPPICND
jgi:hypothetical protein